MDTPQGRVGIDFSVSYDRQNYYLIELPLSLIDSMTSEHAPILYLKSDASNKDSTIVSSPPNALLCTNDKTFEVHQVQSSDSLYILEPAQEMSSNHEEYPHIGSVTAIAECNMILEVIARPTLAVPYLKQRIPVYGTSQLEAAMDGRGSEFTGDGRIIEKQELLDDSPCCLKELEVGLTELCVFYSDEYIWRPSDAVLLAAWASFMSAATVNGLRVDGFLEMSAVADFMIEDGFTVFLIQAMFLRLAPETGIAANDRHESSTYRDKCIPWVGSLLLHTLPSTGVAIENFMSSWRDMLPEWWREFAILELLEGEYILTKENPIIVHKAMAIGIPEKLNGVPNGPSKWHGKLKSAVQW